MLVYVKEYKWIVSPARITSYTLEKVETQKNRESKVKKGSKFKD